MGNKVEFLSDEAAYAMEGVIENACGLIGFTCEVWAETDGGGGTCRDSWLESRSEVSLDKVLESPTKQIDADYSLVCIKDGVAYVRKGEKGACPLEHITKYARIDCNIYATYGGALYRVISAKFE